MSYRKLEIWKLAASISYEIHEMTLKYLPKFEMYEQGSQIRRSSKSARSNIVEGYGRRRYNNEYIRFLIYSISSNDETLDHLDSLYRTNSLNNKEVYVGLRAKVDRLGRMLNKYIDAIELRN